MKDSVGSDTYGFGLETGDSIFSILVDLMQQSAQVFNVAAHRLLLGFERGYLGAQDSIQGKPW